MAQELSGAPGVKLSVTDLSIIIANSLKGINCVQLVTKRGEPGKEYLIGNWNEFKRKLGGLITGVDDPLIGKAALDGGAVLRVTRAFHYTDVDDLATADGTKATGSITGTVTETLAQGSFEIIGGSVSAGVNRITSITVNGVEVLNVAVDFVTDNDTTATAVAAQIQSYTSSPEYDSAAVANKVNIDADTGSGSTPNGYVIVVTTEGDVVVDNIVHMAGGVTAGAVSLQLIAEAVGDGYNGAKITTSSAKSGISSNVDIKIELPDSDLIIELFDVDKTDASASAVTTLNSRLTGKEAGVRVSAINGSIPIGSISLTGGVQTLASIVAADINGSSISKSGWHAFDNVTDSMRIWNFNKAIPEVDIYLANYAESRQDMRAHLRTQAGLTATGVYGYRTGTGTFSHTPIDSFYASMWYTDAEITDPNDADIKDKSITAIGHYCGARARMDRKLGEWFSAAGDFGGKLSGINKMKINFGSAGNKASFDNIYEAGVNAVIEHPTFKITSWGNRSCLLNKTKLTSKDNIADMIVFISRVVKGIAESMSFRPNDFVMFNLLYRSVRPFITDTLVQNRAIQGDDSPTAGEGTWWHWLGDQFAKTPEELSFNTQADIDVGKYRVRFAFKPIASNEYIAIDIAPADSATILNVQILNQL